MPSVRNAPKLCPAWPVNVSRADPGGAEVPSSMASAPPNRAPTVRSAFSMA